MIPGWLAVEAVEETGQYELVYNFEVEYEHTYFVGCDEWGFSVWAHNRAGGCGPEVNAALEEAGLQSRQARAAATKAYDKSDSRLFDPNYAPPAVSKPASGKNSLLPDEGRVGTYDDLIAAGSRGDDITPHHIPSANHMEQHGVAYGDAIAFNMEHPHPGMGGRHRATFTYGTAADVGMTSRQALAAGVADARAIYMQAGLYTPYIRRQLLEVIRQNRQALPALFAK